MPRLCEQLRGPSNLHVSEATLSECLLWATGFLQSTLTLLFNNLVHSFTMLSCPRMSYILPRTQFGLLVTCGIMIEMGHVLLLVWQVG